MGVRVGAGCGGGSGRVVVRERARACAAPVSRELRVVSTAARRRVHRHCPRFRLAPDSDATRVPRSLVLWCFMMVRHDSARYADVP